jgi:hypothetical protein
MLLLGMLVGMLALYGCQKVVPQPKPLMPPVNADVAQPKQTETILPDAPEATNPVANPPQITPPKYTKKATKTAKKTVKTTVSKAKPGGFTPDEIAWMQADMNTLFAACLDQVTEQADGDYARSYCDRYHVDIPVRLTQVHLTPDEVKRTKAEIAKTAKEIG